VPYAASITTNVSPARTDAKSINIGVQTFQRASQACNTIVAGGYSQGAAVMHNVIGGKLSPEIKSKIAGVVLFGDTRNTQDRSQIPNFPKAKAKVFCNSSDNVCKGGLSVGLGHLSYSNQVGPAATFLVNKYRTKGKGGSKETGSGEETTGKGGKRNSRGKNKGSGGLASLFGGS
jgi:cutinase